VNSTLTMAALGLKAAHDISLRMKGDA